MLIVVGRRTYARVRAASGRVPRLSVLQMDQDRDADVRITVCRPECCIGYSHGMVFSIWSSPVRGYLLPDVERSVREAAEQFDEGVTTLSLYRLDRRFPIAVDHDADLEDIFRTLRALRPYLRGSASVLEFDGMLADLVRTAIHGLELLTRGAVQLPVFSRVLDALLWLHPRTPDARSIAHYRAALATMERAHRAALEP
jgi:hypothetical protein